MGVARRPRCLRSQRAPGSLRRRKASGRAWDAREGDDDLFTPPDTWLCLGFSGQVSPAEGVVSAGVKPAAPTHTLFCRIFTVARRKEHWHIMSRWQAVAIVLLVAAALRSAPAGAATCPDLPAAPEAEVIYLSAANYNTTPVSRNGTH